MQRGSIDNANGGVRRNLPRKTDLADDTQQGIHDIVWAIDTTPENASVSEPPPRPSSLTSGVALDL